MSCLLWFVNLVYLPWFDLYGCCSGLVGCLDIEVGVSLAYVLWSYAYFI